MVKKSKVFGKNRRAIDKQTSEFLKSLGDHRKARDNETYLSEMIEKSATDLRKSAETYVFHGKIFLNQAKKPIWFRHRILPYVEAIPTMFSWVPIQKNILVQF